MPCAIDPVQGQVLFCPFNGLFRAVDRMYQGGTAFQGINRKCPGITKRIQYFFIFRIKLCKHTVTPLVKKKSRFLTSFPVNRKSMPGFSDKPFLREAKEVTIFNPVVPSLITYLF